MLSIAPFRSQATLGSRLSQAVSQGWKLGRLYHSVSHPNIIVNHNAPESKLLSKAISHIPTHGFQRQCIDLAVRDMNYPDSMQSLISANPLNLLPEFQLTLFWLKLQRQRLFEHVLDPELAFHEILDEYDRAAYLLQKRLEYNEPIQHHLTQALSQLVLPYNWGHSLEELHSLLDDIAFYAGDMSNDTAWYAKRLLLSSIYVKLELYMCQDTSAGFANTYDYVRSSVEGVRSLGDTYSAVEQWSFFNAVSLFNLVRSQLARG